MEDLIFVFVFVFGVLRGPRGPKKIPKKQIKKYPKRCQLIGGRSDGAGKVPLWADARAEKGVEIPFLKLCFFLKLRQRQKRNIQSN